MFAGEMPHGIFAGNYDPRRPGRSDGMPRRSCTRRRVSAAFSGLADRLRVSSFAEANGHLYAAVGQQIYERIDGTGAAWRLIYTNHGRAIPRPGCGGLTAIPPLPAARPCSRRWRATVAPGADHPSDGRAVMELDLNDFLARAWGMRPGYVIAAYNDMARVRVPGGGEALLIGLQAFIPRNVPIAAGHSMFDAGYAQADSGAWYLVRWPDGHYDLHQVTAAFDPLVAPRSFIASPFPGEADVVYFAGYDAIKAPAHNTAWIARAGLSTVLGSSR